ncbi:hypothetical protein HDU81_003551 [Chytriomyces hyalinus]|nr:hypothetical protein HDU81_003551 [Chytriomyces hyalinus]
MEGTQAELAKLATAINKAYGQIDEMIIKFNKAAYEGQVELAQLYSNQMRSLYQTEEEINNRRLFLEMAYTTELEKVRKEAERVRKEAEEEQERTCASNMLHTFFLQLDLSLPTGSSLQKHLSKPSAVPGINGSRFHRQRTIHFQKMSLNMEAQLAELAAVIEQTQKLITERTTQLENADELEPVNAQYYREQKESFLQRERNLIDHQANLRKFLDTQLKRDRKEAEDERVRKEAKEERLRKEAEEGKARKEAKEERLRKEAEEYDEHSFSELQNFPLQLLPTSSDKKDPASVSSPCVATDPQSVAVGQQQLDLSLPAGSGLRKRLVKSAEVAE